MTQPFDCTRKIKGIFSRKKSIAAFSASLLLAVSFYFGFRERGILYEGKSLPYWEKQALTLLPQGKDQDVVAIAKKMTPEAVPFWLQQLQASDTAFSRTYSSLWMKLPRNLKVPLPEPVSQRKRRNVAWFMLYNLNFTNGIPELIELSYSKDAEIQRYAIQLLYSKAFQFYRPSDECIGAFVSALKAGDPVTRRWAAAGLNLLPLRHEALPALKLALADSDEEVRILSADAITKMEPETDLAAMFRMGMNSSNENVKAISKVALARSGRR